MNTRILMLFLFVCAVLGVIIPWYLRTRRANVPAIPFSKEARDTIERALHETAIRGAHPTTPEHLLLALLIDPQSGSAVALTQFGVDVPALHQRVFHALPAPNERPKTRAPLYTHATYRVLERSAHAASTAHDTEIRSIHLLTGILHGHRSTASTLLRAAGVSGMIS